MNDQEIEALWNSQSCEGLSEVEIWKQLRKHRRKQKWEILLLICGTPFVLGIWLWRVAIAISDSDVTASASLVDVLIVSVLLSVILFVLHRFVRDRRKFENLKNDTRSFIEFLIESTRKEIWEVTRLLPLWLGVVLVLVTVRKWQLIELGHQSFSSLKSLSMPVAVFIIFSVYGFIRAKETLKPKLESLEKSRAAFEE
jgi:hypothetical protein